MMDLTTILSGLALIVALAAAVIYGCNLRESRRLVRLYSEVSEAMSWADKEKIKKYLRDQQVQR